MALCCADSVFSPWVQKFAFFTTLALPPLEVVYGVSARTSALEPSTQLFAKWFLKAEKKKEQITDQEKVTVGRLVKSRAVPLTGHRCSSHLRGRMSLSQFDGQAVVRRPSIVIVLWCE